MNITLTTSYRFPSQYPSQNEGNATIHSRTHQGRWNLRISVKKVRVHKRNAQLPRSDADVTQDATRQGIVQGTGPPVHRFHGALHNVIQIQSAHVGERQLRRKASTLGHGDARKETAHYDAADHGARQTVLLVSQTSRIDGVVGHDGCCALLWSKAAMDLLVVLLVCRLSLLADDGVMQYHSVAIGF